MRAGRSPWWPEVPIGLVLAALGLSANWLAPPGLPRQEWAGVFGVAAGLLVVGVRRFPWAVLVAECALLVVADAVTPTGPDTAQIGAAVALGYLAYRAGVRGTAAAFALFFAATIVNVLDPGNPGMLSGAEGAIRLVMLAGIAAAPVAFGRYVRGVRHAARVAEERAREAETRRGVETRAARLAERAGIARDLHDIVAHHIAAVALRAGSARFAVQHTGDTAEALAALDEVRDTAGQVLDELRALLEVLRDPEAISGGAGQVEPEQMIRDAARLVRDAGLAVRVTVSDALTTAPLVVRTTAARVVREGLTNSLKHAGPGAAASVDVRAAEGGLVVEVRDSGPVRSRPVLPPSGYGLSGMRERVGLLGGTLSAGSTAGGGWCVQAHLPTRENA